MASREPTFVTMTAARTQLGALVERAAGGETIIITRAGVPRARLVAQPAALDPALRVPGQKLLDPGLAALIDQPLPPDVLRAFGGEE